jgi:hypothetical protein
MRVGRGVSLVIGQAIIRYGDGMKAALRDRYGGPDVVYVGE